ncbi:MAG TPA: histidine kinase [Bacteroidota bacterium]|nr:histidine kinase [Bacteroidota bacterium]
MINHGYLRTAGFILVITIVIATGLSYANPERWVDNLFASFVFSACIGLSIQGIIALLWDRLMRLSPLRRLAVQFGVYLVAGFAGTEIGYFLLRFFYFGGHFDIGSHLRLVLLNLILAVVFGSAAAVYLSLRSTAERMAKNLKEKEMNEERLGRLKTRAELDALQARINPHFLFNTLNSIASLISENPAAAESTVEKLSDLFRYTLQRSGNATVRLDEELEIVRSYLEIEKVRFGERLHFDIRADESLNDCRLPPLLIQPLVENSIKHAIASEQQGGSIDVAVARNGGSCVITVSDSGKGFAAADRDAGFGLKSIRERLALSYGERASLRVQEGSPEVRITIPLD